MYVVPVFKSARAGPSSREDREDYFRLARFCDLVERDPDRYVNGINLADFVSECGSRKEAYALIKELERMKVYQKVNEPRQPVRLTPAPKKTDRRVGQKSKFRAGPHTYYSHHDFHAELCKEAEKLDLPFSQMLEYAATVVFGLLKTNESLRNKILQRVTKESAT